MPLREPIGQRGRLALMAFLLCCVAGLLFWYGTLPAANPAMNEYPDGDRVGSDPTAYVGEQVVLRGAVVATEPVVLEVRSPDGSRRVTLEGAGSTRQTDDDPLDVGEQVTVFGTLTDPTTLATERTIVRASWEVLYMYLISFLGGCWVLGRFLRGWQFDRAQLAFVPRDSPRSRQRSGQAATTAASDQPTPADEPAMEGSDTNPGER
ncbi:hypothetical protein [Natrinema salinisoli]|uniref:hypothetical protein n=1 Tax=Natrinema salinisoli TaxID=2878535 RepID=UPI001CF0772D|nr:hypothetical protein [Natrinema salinisoli]